MPYIKNTTEYNQIFKKVHHNTIFEVSNDTRKFEIELYWKRSNYFILFIGATLTAYLAIYGLNGTTSPTETKTILYLLNCVGIITTFAWFLSLKGSKYWQENWEKHVSFNQNQKIGPLFDYVHIVEKTKFPPDNILKESFTTLTKSSPYSVSKLNMLLSIFILVIWLNIFLFISNRALFKIVLENEPIVLSFNSIIRISLFFTTLLFVWLLLKYGESSFKKEMNTHGTNGTVFFKI